MPLSPRPGSGPGAALRRGRGPARGAVEGRPPGGSPPPRGRPPRGRTSRRTRARARSVRARTRRAGGADAVVVVGARGDAPSPSEPSDRERGRDEARRVRTRASRGFSPRRPRSRARARRARVPAGRGARFSAALGIKRRREKRVDRGRRSRGVRAGGNAASGAFGRRVRADDSARARDALAVLGTAPAGRRPADEVHPLFLRRPLVSPSQQRSFASSQFVAARGDPTKRARLAANVRSI